MHKTTMWLTDDNFQKVHQHKAILQSKSTSTVHFADALNDLLEKIK